MRNWNRNYEAGKVRLTVAAMLQEHGTRNSWGSHAQHSVRYS